MTKEELKKSLNFVNEERERLQRELERKDNIINELKSHLEHKITKWQDVGGVWVKAQVQEDKIILSKLKELESGE